MSEKSLDQLIESLKTEAIEKAEKESEKILADAKQQARELVRTAEEKREAILAEARQEAKAIQDKGEAALRQAGRDYIISVRNKLLQVFQTVLEAETRKSFTPDLLKTAIVNVIENVGNEVELKLAPEFSTELADYIHDRLRSSEKTLSIMEDDSVLNGFSISSDKQGWSYTITPEEVAEALNRHLNQNWVNILKKDV